MGTGVEPLHEGRIRGAGTPRAALTAKALSAVHGVAARVERLAGEETIRVPSLARQGESQRTAPSALAL